MNNSEENKKVLNEIHKGLVMGMESLSVIEPKVNSDEFRRLINSQYNEYSDILINVNSELSKYNTSGKDTSTMQKVMGWSSIQMSTMMDDSDSKISDMLIRGTTMGIIEGRKMLNNNDQIDKDVKEILYTFVSKQEHDVEKLKEWL